jgi:hypothetical protein
MSLKLKLDNDQMAEEFFEETSLIGLVAPIKDYQFCWKLNQLLHFDFRLNHDLEIKIQKKERFYYFSIFQYKVPSGTLMHYLYNNKFEGEYLLPEFRNLDYLWLLKGDEVQAEYLKLLMDAIRSINGVQLVVELKPEKIKNKSYMIF